MAKNKPDDKPPEGKPEGETLPPAPPPGHAAELAALKAEAARLQTELADAKAEAALNAEQVAALKDDIRKAAEPKPPAPPKPPAGTRRARVRVPGTHFGELEVAFPADAPNPTQAAIEAAKAARGVVNFGAGPEVELLD